jgi:hypothetical protein
MELEKEIHRLKDNPHICFTTTQNLTSLYKMSGKLRANSIVMAKTNCQSCAATPSSRTLFSTKRMIIFSILKRMVFKGTAQI